jgi:hypothetical protein
MYVSHEIRMLWTLRGTNDSFAGVSTFQVASLVPNQADLNFQAS